MKPLLTVGFGLTLILTPLGAHAGPNQGIALNVHGNVGGVDTDGDVCRALDLPSDCEDLVASTRPDPHGVEWFLAVASSSGAADLDVMTIVFGLGNYDTGACYIAFLGPCHPERLSVEIPSQGWPGPNSGTAVSWAPNCLSGSLEPVYYFGVYTYSATTIPLGDFYPGQESMAVSCDEPREEDPIEAYGSMGCGGATGSNDCTDRGPVERPTTWGQIKSRYK